jgi:hypothetical protein
VTVAGAELKKEENGGFLGMKGSYIGYVVQTTRIRDGAVTLACKRYSAIRAFFEDLMVSSPAIRLQCFLKSCLRLL